tara:strand:- start:1653 stop:2030 length:378 start_codon:yes stop_codon:yes gene_type:complete
MFNSGFNTVNELAKLVYRRRKAKSLTQKQLAALAGTGVRFVFDLEAAKPTCQIQKVMDVLHALEFSLELKATPLPLPEPPTRSPLPAFKISPAVNSNAKKPPVRVFKKGILPLSVKIFHPHLISA